MTSTYTECPERTAGNTTQSGVAGTATQMGWRNCQCPPPSTSCLAFQTHDRTTFSGFLLVWYGHATRTGQSVLRKQCVSLPGWCLHCWWETLLSSLLPVVAGRVQDSGCVLSLVPRVTTTNTVPPLTHSGWAVCAGEIISWFWKHRFWYCFFPQHNLAYQKMILNWITPQVEKAEVRHTQKTSHLLKLWRVQTCACWINVSIWKAVECWRVGLFFFGKRSKGSGVIYKVGNLQGG